MTGPELALGIIVRFLDVVMAPVITRMAFCLGDWTSKRWKDVLHHCDQSFILGQRYFWGWLFVSFLLFPLSFLPSPSSYF